ncbi:MAG: methionyl-tRNA formyltransferase [Oligoflexia bacterium]|nr:methionyl-tRNA formyltransferase [Oligoflexia bacterium]
MPEKEIKKINLIFCGTPDFAVPTINLLKTHPLVNLLKIITPLAKPAGRGYKLCNPAVAEYAVNNQIKLLQTESINKEVAAICENRNENENENENENKNELDIILVLAFCQFLNSKILQLPRFGCFNIHASLLPKYRGASPIQHAILNDEKITGITIQKMVSQMDAGDIVLGEEISIYENEIGGELTDRLKNLSATVADAFINKMFDVKYNGATLLTTPQDEKLVSYAPCLKREDGEINVSRLTTQSARAIQNRIRAFAPWPGTFCIINGKRIKIIESSIPDYSLIPKNLLPAPGKITKNRWLLFGCADAALHITKVQQEGKKVCSDQEFINGIREDELILGDKQTL